MQLCVLCFEWHDLWFFYGGNRLSTLLRVMSCRKFLRVFLLSLYYLRSFSSVYQGMDQCCTDKCKLNKKLHAVCSPSNSACCTKTCKFSPKDVVCAREDIHDRTCTGNATCPGNSDQCGKPKAKPKGSPCTERGECKCSADEVGGKALTEPVVLL